MTFDATDELSSMKKMTQQQIDLIKKDRPIFDIGNGTANTVYRSGTKANESYIVSSEQSYRRSRKKTRPGFLP